MIAFLKDFPNRFAVPTTLSAPLLTRLPGYMLSATRWQALEALDASCIHASTRQTFSGLFERPAMRLYQP